MEYQCGLVLQGGGTRSAFTAGVLDVLMDNKIDFPYVIGTSAGALNAINFLSGDKGRSKEIEITLMRDARFVSLSNLVFKGSVFDFDYLFEVVPKTIIPFDKKTYTENPTRFVVATTDLETGLPRYFAKGECENMWSAIAASSSLPLLTRKPIIVDGHPCLDGGPTANIPFRKALDDGCFRIVVVATRAKGFRKDEPKRTHIHEAEFLYKKYPEFLKAFSNQHFAYNRAVEELDLLEKSGQAFIIRPDRPVTIGRTERKKAKLLALYHEGQEVAKRLLPSLRLFLSSVK